MSLSTCCQYLELACKGDVLWDYWLDRQYSYTCAWQKIISTERTPYMDVRGALVTICHVVCSSFTGNFCWRCQVIHQAILWAMVRACHFEISKKIDQSSSASVLNSVTFWERLENFEFSYIVFFWRKHCQDAQRKLPRQRATWAGALVTRDAADHVVTQFSDSDDKNHDVQIEIRTDNADDASADMPGIVDLRGLILCCKIHAHTVETLMWRLWLLATVNDVKRLILLENWYWEKSSLQKLKNGFRSNLSRLFHVFLSVFCVYLLLSFTWKQ